MTATRYRVAVEGREYVVTLIARRGETIQFEVGGHTLEATVRSDRMVMSTAPRTTAGASVPLVASPAPLGRSPDSRSIKPGVVAAPMPGIVAQVPVSVGTSVAVGDTVAVIEAMKMENPIQAPTSGIISEIFVATGENVGMGQELLRIEGRS